MLELKHLRKLNEKHFLKEDGTIEARIYPDNVHYLKDNKYIEINNTLKLENNRYINKDNDLKVSFAKDSNEELLEVKKSKHYLKFRINNCNKVNNKPLKKDQKIRKRGEIRYNNIFDNIDVIYDILPSKIKESIIIKDKASIKDEFIFNIDTDLELELVDGKVRCGEFIIEKPYMKDSDNKINHNLYYELNKKEEGYELVLKLDKDWLLSDIKYPVYIDPTISEEGITGLEDAYICSALPDENYGDEDYLITTNFNNYLYETLIKFDLPSITTGDSIISAHLNLVGYPNSKVFEPEGILDETTVYLLSSPKVFAYPIIKNWTEDTVTWNNMQNYYADDYEDTWIYRASILKEDNTVTPQINTFNITKIVKKWYSGTPNYGIALISKVQSEDYYPVYFSKDYDEAKPYVVINYRNQNGLETYMDYQEFNLNGLTSYVNNVNGNLVVDFPLSRTIGGNKPINLNLFYNTNDVVLNNDYGFGLGFKLNFYQTLKYINDGDLQIYQYLDSDGTVHYFSKDENEAYHDEDGLSLTLDVENHIIKDKDGNKLIFEGNDDLYYLTQIKFLDDKTIKIIYDNNKIVKVIDGFDQEINISYQTDKIVVNNMTKTININYQNNKLVSFQDNIGTITISYNNNLISAITDIDNQKITFDYYDISPYKMKKVILYGTNNKLGSSYDFSYDLYTTKVKDNKDHIYTNVFNDNGNTVSYFVYDDANDFNKGYGKSYHYGTSNQYKNKILDDLPINRYVNNLLLNTGFEEENQIFSSSDLSISFSNEEKVNGLRSLKLSGTGNAIANAEVPENEYYTFSFYSKSNKEFSVKLNNEVLIVPSSSQFIRHHITAYNESNLTISFILNDNTVYIDDIQLETGKIANLYNMIDNSDFRYGATGWLKGIPGFTSSFDYLDKIITLPNGNKAVRLEGNYDLTKRINFNAKKGEKLYLSFWYKNTAIMDTGVDWGYHAGFNNNKTPMIGLATLLEDGYHINASYLKRNDDWMFYTDVLEFLEDADHFYICFNLSTILGYLTLTNFSLFKIEGYNQFDYDDNSNLINLKDENNNQNIFNYDQNNQLIKMTDPLGNELHYEYDKEITDRILRGISTSGIANEIVYDDIGNPILTKIQADAKELSNGLYHIKLKGSNQYLKVNPLIKNIMLSEDNCSHDVFNITITDQNLNIKPIFHNNIYISNSLFDNISFEFIKQLDNSYMLKLNDKYVTSTVDGLCLSEEEDKINQCFYFENQDSKLYIENSAEYSLDGRFLTKTIDTLFNETSYVTNEKGLITSMTDALGNTTNYTYNTKDQLIKIVKGDMEVSYEYNGTLLSKIIQDNKEYIFNYDEFLNTKSIYINNNKLIENNYEENNGNLISSVYGNNDNISYQYDEFDRLCKLIKMNNTYNYYYDNFGNIKKIDSNDNTYNYEYDFAQRLIGYKENNFEIKYDYNELDNLILEKQTLNNTTNTYSYEHNNEDNITKITNGNTVINYTYDELQRLKERNINGYITKYNYVTNGNRTSSLIDTIEENDDIYKYKYDKLGNIIKIIKNDELLSNYEYDQYNQLIKEENGSETITYEYDNFGNILNKKTYNEEQLITTDTYTYANLNWKDQLTKYNDTIITYDEIGNPLTIGDINLSWINGRQLNSYITNNLNINYKYNKDGIRTEKNVNGNITKYYVEGNKIIYLQKGNEIIYFLYENDVSIGFKYAGNTYYYVKNIQNDVLGILNSEFEQIVEYEYDSYGKIKSIKDGLGNVITDTNHIGYINPFRYRSYYYDDEIGLYYLNSRYYNPTWGRFINADGIIGANRDIISQNLYAYCSNNAINGIDYNGKIVSFLAKQVWNLVSLTLKKIGMPISAEFLKTSLNKEISYLMYFGDTFVSNKIKQDKSFRESLSNKISGVNGYVNDSFQIKFDDVDLRGSFNNATVFYEGKIENGYGKLNIKIYDIYDFDYNSYKGDLINLIFTIGNNLAWLDQSVGIINNYEIYIVFQYDIYN